jgi:predicted DCC family thiol-disulfide oxidoreductase YuxK
MTTAPERVVLIDGVCNLCNSVVHFVIDRDPEARFRFAPLQSEFAKSLLGRAGRPGLATSLETFVLVEGDVVFTHSTAALRVLRELNTPLRFLYAFVVLPRFVRDAAYRFVAKRRYGWFGRTDSCRVPTPELKTRFLA